MCPFDLRRGDAYAVALQQDLVGGDRLAIDADEEILHSAVRNPLGKEFLHRRAIGDFDEVSEACTVVIDLC